MSDKVLPLKDALKRKFGIKNEDMNKIYVREAYKHLHSYIHERVYYGEDDDMQTGSL